MSCYDGAGNEARTRYLHLGKVALYQMSYAREARMILTKTVPVVKPLSEKIKKNLKTGRTAGRKWRHFGAFAAFSRDVSTKSDRKTNESLRASEKQSAKVRLYRRTFVGTILLRRCVFGQQGRVLPGSGVRADQKHAPPLVK